MKVKYQYLLAAASTLLAVGQSQAATIVAGDANAGGIGYSFTAVLGGNESISTAGSGLYTTVGAWSWQQGTTPGVGWTHTSDWYALTLTEATTLTIIVGRNSSIPDPDPSNVGAFMPISNLFPSFTLWEGWDNTSSESHVYNNGAVSGAATWTGGLSNPLAFVDNSTLTTAELTITLPAGQYTIAVGGKGDSASGSAQQGYYTSFTTVPEPSSALFSIVGAVVLLRRRRH